MPLIDNDGAQVGEIFRITFRCKQQMQALRSRYQEFRRSNALTGALAERCITRSNSNLPGNIETFRRSFSRKKYLLRQRTNRCNPDCSQTAILWFVWVV